MLYSKLSHLSQTATLADLPAWTDSMPATELGARLAAAFENQTALPGMIIRNGQELVGVVSRQAFFRLMSGPFAREIFLKRPVDVLIHSIGDSPLELAGACPIAEAALLALKRRTHHLYEPVVVRLADEIRLLDVHVLLLAQSELLAQAVETIRHQKEVAEAASRAKGEFLANMSHEIRTPMNGVLGMIDLALECDPNAEQHEYLNVAKTSADSLLKIINDILDFSKIEAGKLELETIDFDVRAVLADALKALAYRAQQKCLELILHVGPDVPHTVAGDLGRLRQVVINLVNNALKFTSKGEIVVSVTRVEQGLTASNELDLHIAVRDTGIGIPREKLNLIFEPFAQADSSTTRKHGGTGLGLTICARLVEMMQGKIWVESERDQGSTFHCTARVGLPDSAPAAAPEVESLQGTRVLVVDDNATSRGTYAEMLQSWGMSPTVIDSGAAALDVLAANSSAFPLVLLDAAMPGQDGFEVVETLQRRHGVRPLTAVPLTAPPRVIMLLSSTERHRDVDRCRTLGVDCLSKPVSHSDLLNAIITATAAAPTSVAKLVGPTPIANMPRLRILLVEDNATNQLLVLRVLEKQGHAISVANNGKEALAKLGIGIGAQRPDHAYDLVLMDVQMPEMDGFEATAGIRAHERGGSRHIPIIAMTAHAMKGDREQCLAPGMDSYLAKPIRPTELRQAVEAFACRETQHAPRPSGVLNAAKASFQESPSAVPEAALDRDALAMLVGGDWGLLADLIGRFLQELPMLLEAVCAAVAAGDGLALRRSAHALKGAIGIFGGSVARERAEKLEFMGRSNELSEPQAAETLAGLSVSTEQLARTLDELLNDIRGSASANLTNSRSPLANSVG